MVTKLIRRLTDKKLKLFKFIIFIFCLFLIFYLISLSLNPLNQHLFDFHDDTQLSRVHEFILDLKAGQLPPRLAPELSFNLGFPIFNFYAPFSYWVAGLLALIGLTPIYTLKLSFIFSVLLSFVAMYLFLRTFFNFWSSLLGATLYITSTYFAVEIMIRGNLAETWYFVLLPLSLFLITKNSANKSRLIFFSTVISLFFLFTTHNIFSLISLPIIGIYMMLLKNKIRNFYGLFLGILLSSYFLLPLFFEMNQTQAAMLAKDTRYQDHFLCAWQLWRANGWHYGGSVPGCDGDQMSFQLGKMQVVFASLGFTILLWKIFKQRKLDEYKIPVFISLLTLISLFLTLYESQFVWDKLSFIFALFQFPWRFLVFGMLGTTFFSAYLFHALKIPLKSIIIFALIIISFMIGRKYFGKPLYDPMTYNGKYNSLKYRQSVVAYKVREYLTKEAQFNYWWNMNPELEKPNKINFDYNLPIETKAKFSVLKNNYFNKEIQVSSASTVKINVHYFPFWQIYLNGVRYMPNKFDELGRPVIKISRPTTILINFEQTMIEKVGNTLTIFGSILLLLSIYSMRPKLKT